LWALPCHAFIHIEPGRLDHGTGRDKAVLTGGRRIFGCPVSDVEDRRKWIEMDKFILALAAKTKTDIRRTSEQSSVVRHPVLKAEALESAVARPDDKNAALGCRCGWPYTLLVPRGTATGLPFVFFLMLTPGDDIADRAEVNGAVSYCGVLNREYPDIRPMGYPFDRPAKAHLAEYARGLAGPLPIRSASVMLRHV
jgi:tyrosinase